MAWLKGIREVKFVRAEREGHGAIPAPVRTVTDLPAESVARIVRAGPMIHLPLHNGAGPCGTYARYEQWKPRFRWTPTQPVPVEARLSPIAWSIVHLIEPLRAYYAGYRPPMRFGAKPGPRIRRAA